MSHATTPAAETPAPTTPTGAASASRLRAVADTAEYKALRRSFRRFAFPMVIAGLVSYFAYVIASIYAVDVMKKPFLGLSGLTLGMVLGLLQFAIVWIWTAIYVRFANTRIDPAASRIKTALEDGATA